MASNWEAKGSYVFEGSDCIAICDTDNADTATYERRAKIMAAGPELLEHARMLAKSLEYQIKRDLTAGDYEGADLKGFTLECVMQTIAKATTLTIQDQTQR